MRESNVKSRAGWRATDSRRQRANDTRARIIEAAEILFLDRGYFGTSMDQIAEKANVAKMTLYRHFTDKDALFVETLHHQCLKIIEPLPSTPAHSVKEARQSLRRFAKRVLGSVASPDIISLFRIMVGETSRFPKLAKVFYGEGPGKALMILESIFAPLMTPALARQRASAFMHVMLGDTYQRLILGELPVEQCDSHFALQVETAIELALAGIDDPPGAKAGRTRT